MGGAHDDSNSDGARHESGPPRRGSIERERRGGHVVQERTDPHRLGRGCRLRLPRARPEDRRPGDLPHPPGRRLGQLGPPSRRRHRRPAPGHHLRQPRRWRFQRLHAQHHRGDGEGRRRLHPGAGSRAGRPPRLLDGRHDRPGDRRGRTAARPQADPRRHRSRRRRGHHERDPDLASRHPSRAAHSAGPEAVPVLHQDPQRASSRQGVPGPPEGAHREPRQGGSRSGHTAPSSRPSTAGASSRPPTCRSSVSRFSSPTARATGWCPRATRSTWLSACRTQIW